MNTDDQRLDCADRVTKLPESADSVIVAYNQGAGVSGSRQRIDRLAEQLRGLGQTVHLETDLTTIVGRATELVGAGRLRAVVAAGGDGTAGLMANHLPEAAPLVVFPLGTENLLAKHFLMTNDPDTTAATIAAGQVVSIDVGLANEQRFLVMASCGFDADVVQRLHRIRKGNINRFSYAVPLLHSISRYRYPVLRIHCDGQEIVGCWAFVFNAPQYALQLPIVDDASCFDGQLDLCTFRKGNLLTAVMYFFGVLFRRHRRWKDIKVRRCRSIRIESNEPVPFQVDGDPGGLLPLTLSVLPSALKIIVNDRWRDRHLQPAES